MYLGQQLIGLRRDAYTESLCVCVRACVCVVLRYIQSIPSYCSPVKMLTLCCSENDDDDDDDDTD